VTTQAPLWERLGARHQIGIFLLGLVPLCAAAQELQPRAYLPAPIGLTFLGLAFSSNSGGLLFDPSLPVTEAHVQAQVATISVGDSLGLLGRSAQVLAVLPYVGADLRVRVAEPTGSRHRSGLADSTFRFAINLHGAPAMRLNEFAKYRPTTLVGASLTMMTPTGQYDPHVLINIGTNRWAFKPELGVSHFAGKWDLEGAVGVWFYTRNLNYYGGTFRTQDPLGSIQAHIVRQLSHRTWFAVDGTFYTGGRSYVGRSVHADYEGNTRFGATFGFALSRRQALRVAYFSGATTRIGSDIQSFSIAYQVIHQGRR
jgi:Putative MetA-pathway of phenol degradation